MIRIVVDARSVTDKRSGIGNYTDALIRHIVPLASDVSYLLLTHPDRTTPLLEHERVRETPMPGETKSPHTLIMGLRDRFGDFDLFHSPADIVPVGLGCPWVVTTHDLMWLEEPRLASAFLPVRIGNGLWYRFNMGHAIRGARRIIAISGATRDAIGRVYPEHAHRVRVVHHGIDLERYAPREDLPRSLLNDILPPNATFSLIVGQGSPYKNHARMVRAFVQAMGGRTDHKLVLVRRFNRIDAEMNQLLSRPEVASKVVAVPYVSDEVLLALYRHARMLLFVSRYEGFGLPALEAMAMGVAVLGSTTPAVVEITADGALHADPESDDDIAAKIRLLDGDDALRERLVTKGLARARGFSWRRCAEQTLAVYREAVGG